MPFKAPDCPAVKGFIETSFVDWKGNLSSVLFLGGCNFRCPYCHNKDLVLNPAGFEDVPIEYIAATLRKYKNWVDKIVITGGEPTLHMSLFGLIGFLKTEGMKVKLDTNGSNPSVLKGLVSEGLIDCVAMDVKGPLDRYSRWCGINVDERKISESIEFIQGCGIDYQFRMTVVPFFHREEDVYAVARHLEGAKDFVIQTFRPDVTLNRAFSRIRPFSPQKMEQIRKNVSGIMSAGSARQQDDQRRFSVIGPNNDGDMDNLYT
ncbi:MAG TPA: anaerobic ribonucleoside-triphosphate reductase activating protein [Syntrophorhabdaceae bacterium]|nr:anaerobic ribonucleoside-triphosphate reductase activating protein [Syntrophorhabdaceae bacterium]